MITGTSGIMKCIYCYVFTVMSSTAGNKIDFLPLGVDPEAKCSKQAKNKRL